ncbi:MAG: hypothetical protein QF736_00875 [Candidatus Thalassarchaeaceae archaeon]|jgi:uncharacterized membrane protein|nr:hypothetical protein [Euryarchaeota archaeon]MDP6912463.1 hypothetical protein [Candidatus Thalassarchaeaceae archaeon]
MRRPDSAVIIVALLLASFVSTPVFAAADLALSASPTNSTATTEDAAEYDITVMNTGDEDLTVSLSASQDSDCNGFTSNLDSSVVSVGQGESETVTLTVSINDQASGDCVTTVNANGVASNPSENAQADVEVTTTAEGGGQYSVKLNYINPNNGAINYDGEDDEVEWTVDVENTGENDATVQLAMSSKSDCDSDGLDATVEPQQMSLNSGDKDTATVTVNLPDGSSTESGDHCFILDATVSNDPNPADQANDSINLNLKIPEVKTCDSSLQNPSHNLEPGESATNSFTLTNTGNTAWTVSAFATSEGIDVSDWVDFETPTSRLLSEPGGSQDTTSFEFEITPDDSVEPGSVDVYIQGRAGSSVGCESLLRVNLGQVHDASISLSNPSITNVDPGSTASTSMMITNTGNGQDNFAVGVKDLLPGWQVELSETYVTIDGRHCSSSSNCDRKSVQLQITVPANAKANIEFPITLYVNSQGITLDEATAKVTVAAVHGGSIDLPSDSQTGRFGQWVSFPLALSNTGNIQDNFALSSCDPNISESCEDTKWDSRFKDSQGNDISQLTVESEETVQISLEVLVSDNINNNSESFDVRIGIIGTNIMMHESLTVTVSNFNYSMSVAFESPEEDPSLMRFSLPPGGSSSLSFLITNTGDGGSDDVVIDVSGMDSSVLRTISADGQILDGDEASVPSEGQILVTIDFEVLDVESGTSGVIRVSVTSKKNTGQSPSYVDLVVDIRSIHDLRIDIESSLKKESSYPENAEFTISVTNHGNIEEEVEVLTSDSLRGWTVDVIGDEFKLQPGKTREVTVRVTPPSELIADDEYSFTVIVQPKDMPVAGEPIDLTVESKVRTGALSGDAQRAIAMAIILVGSIAVAYLFMRVRAENRMMSDSIYVELDD